MSKTVSKNASGHYIPTNAKEYSAFSKNIHSILDKNITRWIHIPQSAYMEIQNAQNNFRDIQDEFPADPTRAQTTKRNELQKIATSNMRQFIKFYMRNPVITDDELVSMGIPPIGRLKTPQIEVKEEVEFSTHETGKRVWVRACWQNARSILGRWSEVKNVNECFTKSVGEYL